MARRSSKGLGSLSGKTTKGLSLDRVDRPNAKRVKGLHPSGDDAGRFGGTRYPTVLEQYNRDSDYSRWRHGQQLFHGVGQSYADLAIGLAARFMLGENIHTSRTILTLFPSGSSSDFSWTAARRIRGSVVSKVPFERSRVRFDLNPNDPSQDRMIYKISEEFTDDEFLLKHLQLLVGDQFEDSYNGPDFNHRIGDANGSTALTLVEVNNEDKELVFDISKPYGRVMVHDRPRWARLQYDPGNPTIWREGLHVGTAIHYYCSCPDFSGTLTANTQSTAFDSEGRRFPLPAAQRKIRGDYEAEMAGFQKRWRDLAIRADGRKECKHIHCLRWQTRTAWFEPDDIPLGGNEELIHAGSGLEKGDAFSETIDQYMRNRVVDWQNVIQAACGAMGFNLNPVGDMALRSDRPQLWILDRAPEPEHCRQNDYWLERGSKRLWLYMEQAGDWVDTLPDEEGEEQPIAFYLRKEEVQHAMKDA